MNAAQRLRQWIERTPDAVQRLVRVCVVSVATVGRWALDGRPPEHLRPALFVLTGIRPRDWRTPKEARLCRNATARAMTAARALSKQKKTQRKAAA